MKAKVTALLTVSLLAPMALPHALAAVPLAGRKPNIVLILTDDQGYGDLSCHGNPILKTPHLDRLHDEAVRFTDFQVSTTCAPTRSSLLTGRHEFKSGVTHTILERERLSLKATTLAQLLQSAGYTTGIFGKWHLGDEPERWPDKRGFDEMFIHGAGGIGQTYAGSCGDAPGNSYFNPVILHNGRFVATSGYCTDVFFRQAREWIGRRPPQSPFFAYITPNAPHAPLICPEAEAAAYRDRVPTNVAAFFGMIANIDRNVGQLLAQLRSSGLETNTLVIFMNDNGGTAGLKIWNAGLRAGKGTPYNGGTRAASFWRWPGTLRPADAPALTAHIDVLPTLIELAGVRLPASLQLDGRSLAPLLVNPASPWPDRHLFTHIGRWPQGADPRQHKYNQVAVRSSRYHLVCNSKDGAKRWELYEVAPDPAEQHNLATQRPEVVRELERAYDQWWDSVLPCLENERAQGPLVNPFKALYWRQYNGPGPNNVPPPTSG